MAESVPELQYTSIDSIPPTVSRLRSTFNSQKTKPLEFRLIQLRKLYWALRDNEAAIAEACKRDLGRSSYEAYVTEIDWCKNDIIFVCNHLEKWAKDEKAPDQPLTNSLMSPKVRKDPLGCIFIIGYVFPGIVCWASLKQRF